uniref:membrane cofactor protein-like n=1 Tax=Jaculus jaculus TaxID=51337 RepID=UPI00064CE367|nr:membrane cofactor protein-like [Jaculus jaculus]
MVTPQHSQNLHSSPFCILEALQMALVIVLSTSSDACGSPPTFENMELTGIAKPNYAVGERVQYACKPGYRRQFSLANSIVCTANGWPLLSKAVCLRKSCPRQNDPVNGQINLLNGSTEFGTQIEFVCNEGFFLIGKKILLCLLKGSGVHWSDNPPHCEKILCEPPPNIDNGKYTPSDKEVFAYQEVVTYTCNPKSGPDEFSLVGNRKLYCSGMDSWSGDPPQCKVVKCPHPVIKNGQQTSGFRKKYSYKDTAVFRCNKGFVLHGNDTIICESDSTWQPPVPTCRKKAPLLPPTKPPYSTNFSSFAGSGGCPPKEGPLDFKDFSQWIVVLLVVMLL